MSLHVPALARLVPLPINRVPFNRGYEYILVVVDYATDYPKAVPPQKATSMNIACELVLLFSQVGNPKKRSHGPRYPHLLTDAGPLPASPCAAMLDISVPYTEWFNQMLKCLL